MAGVVNIPKVTQIAGGILGDQSKALQAIRDALEGIKGDWPIRVESSGKNSLKVTYQGIPGESGAFWSGVLRAHDGVVIASWTIDDELTGFDEYLCYDGVTGIASFQSSPDSKKHCWHVCEIDSDTGQLVLSGDTCGDAVMPVPDTWIERQVLQSDVDSADAKLKFDDLKITGDKEGEESGFIFAKPEDEEDGLSQMKPTGIGTIPSEKQVGLLATSGTSAAWGVIETDPWPENSKVTVVTGVDAEIDMTASGNTLTIRLRFLFSEIDFNAHTITEKPELYSTGTISGVTC
jgi:hypothetical protein